MKTLERLREEITRIDTDILLLFDRRMDLAGEVAKAKAASGAPLFDPVREEAVLAHARVSSRHPETAVELMETLMRLSREHQKKAAAQKPRL